MAGPLVSLQLFTLILRSLASLFAGNSMQTMLANGNALMVKVHVLVAKGKLRRLLKLPLEHTVHYI